MNFIFNYLITNYPTILVITAIIVLTAANRNARIEKSYLIHILAFITLVLSLLEYWEMWIDEYGLDYRLLYLKAMLIYWLYPALALILLYMIYDIKSKLVVAIPQIINMVVCAIDLTDTRIVYWYGSRHNYEGGPLRDLPFVVEDIYVILIAFYSIKLLRENKKTKSIIVIFMMITTFLAQILALNYMPNIYMPTVMAIEIFTYYFYMSAIQYMELQEKLNESRLALEHNRSNLLMAQIRPHFINSNLAVIRSLCYEDVDKAVEMIDHFSGYLQENIRQIDDMRLVSFSEEMDSVDNYLYLEMQRFPDRIEVIKDITVKDFQVPPLSIQTIVENAVRYGISMMGHKGTVIISTEEIEGDIIIKVADDGKGFDVANADLDGINHVGIKNVQDRFERILGGSVSVISEVGKGTTVTFFIPGNKSNTPRKTVGK